MGVLPGESMEIRGLGLTTEALQATERSENKKRAGYFRDRDFDYEPPADLTKPTVDHVSAGVAVGWRWCRHETENYLIDPQVVAQATKLLPADYEAALKAAAASIHHYEAAR